MGKTGLRDVAALNLERSRELATAVSKLDGVDLKFCAPFFNEVVVDVHQPARDVLAKLQERKILGWRRSRTVVSGTLDLHPDERNRTHYPGEIDALAAALGEIVRVHASV